MFKFFAERPGVVCAGYCVALGATGMYLEDKKLEAKKAGYEAKGQKAAYVYDTSGPLSHCRLDVKPLESDAPKSPAPR